jgi:hypothetical protein
MNIQLARKQVESSQNVRKAVFCALSRIGRRYPKTQDFILPLFNEAISVSN